MNFEDYEMHMKEVANEMKAAEKLKELLEEEKLEKKKQKESEKEPVKNINYKIQPLWLSNIPAIEENKINTTLPFQMENELYSIQFSHDGEVLAGSCANGNIKLWNSATGAEKSVLLNSSSDRYPTMCIDFKPQSKTKQILLSCNVDGRIIQWHVPSKKILNEVWQNDNALYTCTYNMDGSHYGVAGKDRIVYIYDSQTNNIISKLERGEEKYFSSGHSSRIFALKNNPIESTIYYSAGWDNSLQIWDTRVGQKSIQSIPNLEIRGEGIDINNTGNHILVANCRSENALQIYDIKKLNEPINISWGYNEKNIPLFSCKYSNDNALIAAAGGKGTENSSCIFVKNQNYKCCGAVTQIKKQIYSVAFSPFNDRYAVAGGDGIIRVVNIIRS